LESFPKDAVLLHPMLRRGIDLRDPGHTLCQLGSDLLQVADKLCAADPRPRRISVLANFRDDSQRGLLFDFEQHLNVVAVKEIDVFDFLESGEDYRRQVTPRFRPCHGLPPSFGDSPFRKSSTKFSAEHRKGPGHTVSAAGHFPTATRAVRNVPKF